jgi:hypothetical protein
MGRFLCRNTTNSILYLLMKLLYLYRNRKVVTVEDKKTLSFEFQILLIIFFLQKRITRKGETHSNTDVHPASVPVSKAVV